MNFKSLLLFLIISMPIRESLAQLTGGIKGGLNAAQVHAKSAGETETSDMMVGFQFGGYLAYSFSEKISFQPELVFTRVGGKESAYDSDLQQNFSATLKTDYLSVPVLCKFKLGKNFNFLLGPQIGILVSAKAKIEVFGQSVDVDVKEAYKAFDFGFTGGFGYTLKKIEIDARYNFGLANVIDDPAGESKAQNRTITLAVSYLLFEK